MTTRCCRVQNVFQAIHMDTSARRIVPAATGTVFTVIVKLAEEIPAPQPLTPETVRFPEVAAAEKLPVMEFVAPDGVNPVPE